MTAPAIAAIYGMLWGAGALILWASIIGGIIWWFRRATAGDKEESGS